MMLHFSILGCLICVDSDDARALALLRAAYGAMAVETPPVTSARSLRYRVGRVAGRDGYFLQRSGQRSLGDLDRGAFLYAFEKDMTIEVEKLRRDYYFLHAAAVSLDGRAALITAPSGTGKSTTTWALLHHGFSYASDELAPIDPDTMEVHPYPHALCLKNDPPAPYGLPAATVRTARTLHVPVSALPCPVAGAPLDLEAVFFLRYCPDAARPVVRPLRPAVAGARLYANALNALAHSGDGLDAAIAIARRARCFELDSADLGATSALIHAILAAADRI